MADMIVISIEWLLCIRDRVVKRGIKAVKRHIMVRILQSVGFIKLSVVLSKSNVEVKINQGIIDR